MTLTKKQAIEMFDTAAGLARAIGVTRSAIGQWPDELDDRKTNEVIGAAVRLGKKIPRGIAQKQPVAI